MFEDSLFSFELTISDVLSIVRHMSDHSQPGGETVPTADTTNFLRFLKHEVIVPDATGAWESEAEKAKIIQMKRDMEEAERRKQYEATMPPYFPEESFFLYKLREQYPTLTPEQTKLLAAEIEALPPDDPEGAGMRLNEIVGNILEMMKDPNFAPAGVDGVTHIGDQVPDAPQEQQGAFFSSPIAEGDQRPRA